MLSLNTTADANGRDLRWHKEWKREMRLNSLNSNTGTKKAGLINDLKDINSSLSFFPLNFCYKDINGLAPLKIGTSLFISCLSFSIFNDGISRDFKMNRRPII